MVTRPSASVAMMESGHSRSAVRSSALRFALRSSAPPVDSPSRIGRQLKPHFLITSPLRGLGSSPLSFSPIGLDPQPVGEQGPPADRQREAPMVHDQPGGSE